MNEHSFSSADANLSHVSPAPVGRQADRPVGDKRDAILRAATKVFAQNGFFQSQVADVARVAGVAAGTVYLYFRSKDDLLVSIFERTMREVIAEGRTALEGVADPAERLRADRPSAPRTARQGQGPRRRLPGRAAAVGEVHGALLLDVPAGLLRLIRATIADGQQSGAFRKDVNATTATKIFFGALDEMATNWMLSRRRYSLTAEADAVVDLFINGVGRAA